MNLLFGAFGLLLFLGLNFSGVANASGGGVCQRAFEAESSKLSRLVSELAHRRVLSAGDLERLYRSPVPVNPFDHLPATPANVNFSEAFRKFALEVGDWSAFQKSLEKLVETSREEVRRESHHNAETKNLFLLSKKNQFERNILWKPQTMAGDVDGAKVLIAFENERISRSVFKEGKLLGVKELPRDGGEFSAAFGNNEVWVVQVHSSEHLTVINWTDPERPSSKMLNQRALWLGTAPPARVTHEGLEIFVMENASPYRLAKVLIRNDGSEHVTYSNVSAREWLRLEDVGGVAHTVFKSDEGLMAVRWQPGEEPRKKLILADSSTDRRYFLPFQFNNKLMVLTFEKSAAESRILDCGDLTSDPTILPIDTSFMTFKDPGTFRVLSHGDSTTLIERVGERYNILKLTPNGVKTGFMDVNNFRGFSPDLIPFGERVFAVFTEEEVGIKVFDITDPQKVLVQSFTEKGSWNFPAFFPIISADGRALDFITASDGRTQLLLQVIGPL